MGRGGRKGAANSTLRKEAGNNSPKERIELSSEVKERVREAQISGRSPKDSLRFAQEVGDGLGRGLDPGSIRPVAALHFLGIETTASCDGHEGRAHAFPWIDISSKEEGEILLGSLPSWTIVQRGQGEKRSYRLNPREVSSIDNTDFDHLPWQHWQPAREEMARFANSVLN